jgi:hypothetical protein
LLSAAVAALEEVALESEPRALTLAVEPSEEAGTLALAAPTVVDTMAAGTATGVVMATESALVMATLTRHITTHTLMAATVMVTATRLMATQLTATRPRV